MKTGISNRLSALRGHQAQALNLPAFDGFPYLWTRVVPAFYHLIVLPRSFEDNLLRDIARRQVLANRLRTCLVLGEDDCCYYDLDGTELPASYIPRGGCITSGKLQLCISIEEDEDVRARQRLLAIYQHERNRGGGYVYGDLTKGGRDASLIERLRLMGRQTNGVPRGLTQCAACREWKGRCLDPNPVFKGKVMEVSCLCDNHNRCAACGRALHARKLNANYFDMSDGQIWHLPGFCGFNHRCADVG